ncbi:ABC transporter substrate-binding protein [Corynebacterium nasicanis]|uniref:ABC transporter substrate-binding protein n=1 Tax=Corynebacterium nasicanis TaxID=1448267 RepID=A0ABW1QB26_9CORY
MTTVFRAPRQALLLILPLFLLLALVLSACTPAVDTSGAGSTEVAAGGARFHTADEETARLGSDAAPGVFPRTVTHDAGTTEITAKPQRVVVLDTGELDAVLALGITPVGMVTTQGATPVPSYLVDRVKDVATVGTIQEINVEAIAALQPDLILGSTLRVEKLYPQLSAIAPTVFSIRPGYPWKENFLLAADALGEEEKATAILNGYAAELAAIKGSVAPETTVSIVRFMPGKIRLYGRASLTGVVLADAGLARPTNQQVDELSVEISPEEISEADADIVFYSSYGAPDATGESEIIASRSWQEMSAAAAGLAIRVDDDVWFLGLGPIGALQIAEELAAHLEETNR